MGYFPLIRWAAASLAAVAVCVGGLVWLNGGFLKSEKVLHVVCAASLQGPVGELATEYERSSGTRVVVQYGGSGALLAAISARNSADVFIPADGIYLELARQKGLGEERVELATMAPVLAVAAGNPKQVLGWQDLLARKDLRLGLCHAESAAIGKMVKSVAVERGEWESLAAAAVVMKGTVSEIAVDLRAGALDVGFVWDQTAAGMGSLEVVPCPELAGRQAEVAALVLRSTDLPSEAREFSRWLASKGQGKRVFRKHHFTVKPTP